MKFEVPNNYSSIPEELRLRPQWCVWRYEDIGAKKPTKVPYDAKTGRTASVTDKQTWCSFEEAFNTLSLGSYNGLGFIFSKDDPYCFIDLDDTEGNAVALDRQLNVFKEFDSYAEISPSGKGLHIIIKGNVPSGRRRAFIEIYSSERYATMTGNVYNNKPINDHSVKLTELWAQMGSTGIATTIYQGDDVEKEPDEKIIEQAASALNGDKFLKLYKGNWQEFYPSQSEADFALINIIAFYTQNKIQIARIFRASGLGQRDKAKRSDYISWMINKSFDRLLPPIDFDGFKIAIENELNKKAGSFNGRTAPFEGVYAGSSPAPAAIGPVAQSVEPTAHNGFDAGSNPAGATIPLPPGLMGEIAQFIYQVAPRPVPEVALAGAIGLLAGITGRAYNISGTGLNQYILMLAPTGTGKEAAALGIDKLMNAIRMQVPTSSHFIGPSEIASGQALVKHLNKNNCFVSLLGEFGLRLQSMSNSNAHGAEISLRRMILDLFNKSGHEQVFRPSIYADKDKNIEATLSPAFSILGESTPERFYSVLNEDMISEGLLPRFNIIEYSGKRPARNLNHLNIAVPIFLVDRLALLAATAEQIMHSKKVINVEMTKEAETILDIFDKKCDARINGTSKEIVRHLWNRAHMKVLKMSGLIAVGVNLSDPVVTPEYVEWSKALVENDIHNLTSKFEKGEIGAYSEESRQIEEIYKCIKMYLQSDWGKISGYCKSQTMHESKVVPYEFLQRKCISLRAFRLDRQGSTNALKRAIQLLIDSDQLREVSKLELTKRFGTTGRGFILNNFKILEN